MENKSVGIIVGISLVLIIIVMALVNMTSQNNKVEINNETPPIVSGPQPDNCIITINGDLYDVTDIILEEVNLEFKCGTDMTQEYFEKYGEGFEKIAPYKI